MSRMERRADRIRTEISIEQVLANYGYDIRVQGGSREQQFRCDLHGDGNDGKPSARCYPENNSWYCWACRQSRDAVQTVREKDGVNFVQAVEKLEKMFNLPSLPWEEGDYTAAAMDPFAGAFDPPVRTFEDESRRVGRLIKAMCAERSTTLGSLLTLMEEYDHMVKTAEVDPSDLLDPMIALRIRVVDSMRAS